MFLIDGSLRGFEELHGALESNFTDLLIDTRRRNPVTFLQDFVLCPGHFLGVGAKIKCPESLEPKMSRVLEWLLNDREIRILHLKRGNRLRRLVSHQLALQSRVSFALAESERPKYRKIRLTLEHCTRDIEETIRHEETFDTLFAGHAMQHVSYERLHDENSGHIAEVLDRLEARNAAARPVAATLLGLPTDNFSRQDLSAAAKYLICMPREAGPWLAFLSMQETHDVHV